MTKRIENKKIFVFLIACMLILIICSAVHSHCQIPCGIYDDDMRFNMMAEHIATIEKSIQSINELSGQEKPNMNQLVRWIQNKDNHADQLSEVITYYFMAQRLKPAEKTDAAAYEKYLTKLTLLHQMLVTSMKSKQGTDLATTKQLNDLLSQFKKAYYEEHGHEH